jgi:hypothetical protein
MFKVDIKKRPKATTGLLLFALLSGCAAFDQQSEKLYGEYYREVMRNKYRLSSAHEIGDFALSQTSGMWIMRASLVLLEIARTENEPEARVAIAFYIKVYDQLHFGWPRTLSTDESLFGTKRQNLAQPEFERALVQHMALELSNVAARYPNRKFLQEALYKIEQ